MKKFLSIISCLILGLGLSMAQENYKTVKGYVIDKNGNPIPGAEVLAPGGGESAITDSDGSFQMNVHPLLKKLSATYDGMTTKTLKIKSDKQLVFKLKKERVHPGFLNAVTGFGYNLTETDGDFSIGLMGGMLGKWGFYGKGVVNIYYLDFSVTAGVIKSIYKRNVFIYAGAGYGNTEICDYYYEGYYYDYEYYDDARTNGIAADLGFIFKIGQHFNLTFGYNLIHSFAFESDGLNYRRNNVHGVQVGFGYVF